MKHAVLPFLLLGFSLAHATDTANVPVESCDQIRAQIKAQTGVLARPDTVLLGKVGANKQCRFTSAEAYRAAWGDKPMPKDDRPARRSSHHKD
jgi:hypothetical protein